MVKANRKTRKLLASIGIGVFLKFILVLILSFCVSKEKPANLATFFIVVELIALVISFAILIFKDLEFDNTTEAENYEIDFMVMSQAVSIITFFVFLTCFVSLFVLKYIKKYVND